VKGRVNSKFRWNVPKRNDSLLKEFSSSRETTEDKNGVSFFVKILRDPRAHLGSISANTRQVVRQREH